MKVRTLFARAAKLLAGGSVAFAAFISVSATASETISYKYDARGRLIRVTHGGPINQGTSATYSYDRADNRSSVTSVASWITRPLRAGDFNGDGRSDLMLRDDTPFDATHSAGTLVDWLSNSSGSWTDNWSNSATAVEPAWKIAAFADINGDGRSDIIWRKDVGYFAYWLSTATGGWANGSWGGGDFTTWTIVDVMDFDGDGRPDILWRNDDGTIKLWLGQPDGSFVSSTVTYNPGNAWQIAGVGDYNGDGRGDILWRATDGTLTDWIGQAGGMFADNSPNFLLGVSNDWHIVATGDFNGDGYADIIWRNDDTTISEWQGTATGALIVCYYYWAVGANYRIAAVGDFNGDGRDDLLFRNTTGGIVQWLATATGEFTVNSASSADITTNWNVEPR